MVDLSIFTAIRGRTTWDYNISAHNYCHLQLLSFFLLVMVLEITSMFRLFRYFEHHFLIARTISNVC